MRLGPRTPCRWAFMVVLGLVFASCASGPESPRWVRGKAPKDFPETQYIWGAGSGAKAEAAAAAAILEIARKTSGESEGAQIERTWIDKEGQAHWALAVLDRPAQLERLAGELAAVDAQLVETLASRDQEALPSKAFVVTLRAIELASARDAIATRIGRLGGAPPPSDPAHARAGLEEQLASLKHAVTIDVEAWEMDSKTGMIGDPLNEVRMALAQQVLEHGFRIGTNDDWSPSSAWLLIRARVGIDPLDLGTSDRFVAVKWSAAVEILDRTGEGEVLAILTKEGRATHLNEHEASREAREQAESFVANALTDWLDERTTPRS